MKTDIAFIHPPSIYDFRKRNLKAGPISDVVPSTPVFEMYPMGFLSMLSYLVPRGYNARISNVASMMVMSDKFDPVKYLKSLDTEIYGIDLHWLPHVHGAISIARIIKEFNPDARVLLGGFSASYFSDDIMKTYPEIDYVLKGDFQEYSTMKLIDSVEKNIDLGTVPNLVYRDEMRHVKHNPNSKENTVDNVFLNYKVLMRNAIKYHDVKGHLPYADWINNPESVTIIEHGCQFNCAFCGGSNFSYRNNFFPVSPVYRNPETIAKEIELAREILGAPIFVAGDINLAGEKFYGNLFREIKELKADIPILTEYFKPPQKDYLNELSRSFGEFSVEISPESSSENIRRINGREYSNESLEKSIADAKEAGCKKFDVYFTLGISGQGEKELKDDIEYATKLMKYEKGSEMKVYSFISPLTPFIDPGSLIYEKPEKYGFHITARTIEEYYNLLDKGKSWVDFLNYYNDWMSAKDIERLTYQSEIEMITARRDLRLIDSETAENIINNINRYIDGKDYQKDYRKNSHLSYLNKDIEWSKKHNITRSSLMVYWYKELLGLEKDLGRL
ncbi:TIGR04190 family B12-binding domain/radical SAM domain protein [Cuniculiplasma divulgatum]|jgi:B12-binding domain/radical SAM domain protein|uniref:Radical SAM superfamily enzyme n=1 Tax=Cuniculiplasma divulgatum TaxID=1673428 RepID=A0A1N5V8C4_9ARCH|nr:TIGR04190 family B12-binding domain/radical SAM domain protein [Cuniculiplasma divulgatum]SIM68487.1 radical SAM superfamily enzyme [Cuniculiplasma divulgatum]